LEIRSFFPPHIILGVGKQRDLGNKICQTVGDALRTCLAGVLFGFGSSSSREVMPNVLLEEQFFSKKQRSQSRFGGAMNQEEPLRRSHAKQPLILKDFLEAFLCSK
jgi:hypothetical protein